MRKLIQPQFAAIVIVFFTVQPAVAADVTPEKVDQVFAAYAKPDSPGCSLGVIRNGDFVYRKAYGSASLELRVPLSSDSVFYMGSVSKQFTAAAVVLAAEQGFLSLDDDIHKFVPESPDYGHPITLRQMLHHTSGFRDFLDLIYLSDRDALDFNSPEEVLKLIVRQKKLNNTPGDQYIYSNTNYFLLGVVIQRATKKSLAEFASQNIFQPLEMSRTLFYDDHTAIVPGRVAAYDQGDHGNFLVDWSTTYAIVGGGGLMSSVDDLLKWDRNFYADRLGNGHLTTELQARGVLNNGKQISYALGLNWGSYRGLPIVEHDGALFGYRTNLLRFPEQKFTVICLCNVSSAVPANLSRKIADLYLKDLLEPEVSVLKPQGGVPDPVIFAGKYLDSRTHMIYGFTASGGNLMAWGGVLRRRSANQFYDLESNVITFEKSNGTMKASWTSKAQNNFLGTRVEELHLNTSQLSDYGGQFRSEELKATYNLSVEQGALKLRFGDRQPTKLNAIASDEFEVDGLGAIVFHRNQSNTITSLSLFSHSSRGIEFNKTNASEAVVGER